MFVESGQADRSGELGMPSKSTEIIEQVEQPLQNGLQLYIIALPARFSMRYCLFTVFSTNIYFTFMLQKLQDIVKADVVKWSKFVQHFSTQTDSCDKHFPRISIFDRNIFLMDGFVIKHV